MMASRGLTAPKVARMCHYLLLSMMRYYREEGLSEKWLAASEKIEAVKHTLSSRAEARFHYERTLFSIFSLDLEEGKRAPSGMVSKRCSSVLERQEGRSHGGDWPVGRGSTHAGAFA